MTKSLNKSNSPRFLELDVLRGLAIIIMVFLHILWDLDYFGLVPLNLGIYRYGKIAPVVFFILLGMCLIVSKNRKINLPDYDEKRYNKHLFMRGLKIIGLGMIFTMITMVFIPDRPIFLAYCTVLVFQ